MKKRTYSLSLFLLFVVFFVTCNKKKEGLCIYTNDKAALKITVIDNKGVKIDGALVTIFDSYEQYLSAVASKNNPATALDSVKSLSASEVTLMSDSYQEHWLLATFYDPIQQKYLSSELTVSKIDKLQACSDYHITLKLDLIGANVAFWTDLKTNLPITIKFDNVSGDLLGFTSIKPSDPSTPGAPNALVFPTKAGTYQYQASSKDGCSWAGEVVVADGQFTTIQLETCKRALVAFYFNTFSNVPLAKQSIDIFVDNNPKSVGTLTAAYTGSTLPNSCPSAPSTDNVLYIYLEPGVTHSYKAVSPPGVNGIPCVWSGNTSVLSTDCNLNPPVYINQGCL